MKKFLSLSLVTVLLISMLAVPAFAEKPEEPGNSNKPEKVEKEDKEAKEEKIKEDKEEKIKIKVKDDKVEVEIDEADEGEEEEIKPSDKVKKYLKKWHLRYEGEEEPMEDEDVETADEGEEEYIFNEEDTLPWGLAKKGEDLPEGLAKKEILPYGLLKKIDPEAMPKGQIKDEITGEDINVEALIEDADALLAEAVETPEGEDPEMGEYFPGTIAKFERAYDRFVAIINDEDSTEKEIEWAIARLQKAYDKFVVSRTALQEELDEFNEFLDEVADAVEANVVIGDGEDEVTQEEYDAFMALLEGYVLDEGEVLSLEAIADMMDMIIDEYDEFTGFKLEITEA